LFLDNAVAGTNGRAGAGTRRTISINGSDCEERGMADHYGSPEIDLSGLCVLIVDDSFAAALGVKRLLEAWGADILGPAATIAEAEHMVSERNPDVAIVDITLRGGEQSHA